MEKKDVQSPTEYLLTVADRGGETERRSDRRR